MDLVLVDGPNVFNSVARHLERCAGEEKVHLARYFLDWFDFDRVVLNAIGTQSPPTLGIVIFHSSKALGGGPSRLDGDKCNRFWARQAGNLDTSDVIVDVPADQREHYDFTCKCGEKNSVHVSGEKGVDSAMIVHMFETVERWERLAILSRDVDFAPAVTALRRRGKQVYAVGEPGDERSGLGRAAQSFFSLPFDMLLRDFGLFLLCRKGGVLDQWRAEAEDAKHVAGFFWVQDFITVLLKGDLPAPRMHSLRDKSARLPGVAFRGEGSDDHRQSGLSFQHSLLFRKTPLVGEWAKSIVRDARDILDPNGSEAE